MNSGRFRRRESLTSMADINVTPLLDLAFALLIIFMITTPLLEQTIPLKLPQEEPTEQNAATERPSERISVDRDGMLYWGEQPVDEARLEELMERVSQDAEKPVLHIRADGLTAYQKVTRVLNLAKKYGLNSISLDTQLGRD